MRSLVVLAIALLVAPMGITSAETPGRLSVLIINADEQAALVVWTPDAHAIAYEVYRGPTPELATLFVVTGQNHVLDEAPTPGDTWYIIRSIRNSHGGTGSGGSCVEHSGTTGVSVTSSSCI